MPIISGHPKEKSETSSKYAYDILRENIMTLHLAPGQVINESLLSEHLAVSRTPVREALFRLKQEHLIDIVPQRESLVSKIDFPLVHEALFLRSTMEPVAIREASAMITPKLIADLEKNLMEQQNVLQRQTDYHLFFLLDNSFHQLIYHAAGLEHLWENISQLSTHYDRIRYLDIIIGTLNLEPLYRNHRKIFQCIIDHKTQHIDSYLLAHLSSFLTTKVFLKPEFYSYFNGIPSNKH